MIPYTAFATAILALLFVALAANVSRLRGNNRVSLGDGGNMALTRAVRAHANLAEFAPIFLLLLLGLELGGAGGWLLGLLVAGFVFGRFAHALGMLNEAFMLARRIGAGLSYGLIVLAALCLLF